MAFIRSGKRLLLSRNFFDSPLRCQGGYVVLLPEIGEEAPEKNPLYHSDGLPKFNQITIENCRAAMAKQTLDFEVAVQNIEQHITNSPKVDAFQDIIVPIEKAGNPMETNWGLSKTLYLGNNTLMPTSSYMAIHERARSARAAKYTSPKIYYALKEDYLEEKQRTSEETRILQKFILEGKLNGLDLTGRNKTRFTHDFAKLAKERKEFRIKNEIATRHHSQMVYDNAIVRDFPEKLLKATAVDPTNYMSGPWRFMLTPQLYMPLLQHCPDREIRWVLWKAHVDRGSVSGDRDFATSLNVEEIRYLRNNIAKLLGYKTYVDMSMETKMAGSKEEVDRVLGLLLEHAKPCQDKEMENLVAFANDRGFKVDKLELWDVPYWRLKQRTSAFNYDENKIKDFFPLNTVLDGLFQLCEKLFNIVIKARSGVTAWHKDVRFYDIFETHSSAPVAGFYLDPYARSEDKLRADNSGWMVGIQSKSEVTNSKPLAALIFDFEAPSGDKQSHLTFNDVRNLFHKFGHSLQHLLTRTYYAEVAGHSNIEWDAVGISGHMLCHWLFNEKVIESISCHCGSGDKLPKAIFDNIRKAYTHMAGYDLCTELYLSALDLELHSTNAFWLDIVKRLWPHYRSFDFQLKYDSHPCNFKEIFTEDWGAAYYSSVWSRMIAADVYSAFYEASDNEEQIKDVGKRFRDTFLAAGGSQHPAQVFREFRGRDPSHKALLKSLGLKLAKQES